MDAFPNFSAPSPHADRPSCYGSTARISARVLALLAPLLLVSCKGGGSGSSSPSPSPVPAVRVTPANGQVEISSTAQLTVTVKNSSNTAVTWEVNGVAGGGNRSGTVSSNGLYTAPASVPSPSDVTVTAVLTSDPSISASAFFTITPPPTLTPERAAATSSQTVQFDVAGPYMTNATVNWTVDGIPGGNASSGTISNGLYTPGAAGTHQVLATSSADATESAAATVYVTDLAGNFSWRNNLGITGENTREVALSPSTLSGGKFGKLFSCPVDGQIYAQPLYFASFAIPGDRTHNVVFVATEHDSVYAFDADANPCEQLWKRSFLSAGVTTVPSADVGSENIAPEIGITGTPVIDPSTQTLYVVAETKENGTYVHRLHALNILDGQEKTGSPVEITASVPGTGDGNDGMGNIPFKSLLENQRAALRLFDGQVFIPFASHGDNGSYHGWLLAYDAATLAQTATFNATPDGSQGGIWQSGAAPSVDSATGNIYLGVGNGTFDANSSSAPNDDYGNTLLRLQFNASPGDFSVVDTFTPFDQLALYANDADFASTGVLLLPDEAGSALHPHLALVGSKAGYLYLVDRDHFGGYTPGGPDNVVEKLNLGGPLFGTPAYWNGTIYAAASGQKLQAFPAANGTITSSPTSQSAQAFAFPPPSPVVSSDGASNGVVWALDNSGYATSQPAVLHAYDAADLGTELYSSAAKSGDMAGGAVKFTVPTVANGKVYVGTQTEITVYGLLPGP